MKASEIFNPMPDALNIIDYEDDYGNKSIAFQYDICRHDMHKILSFGRYSSFYGGCWFVPEKDVHRLAESLKSFFGPFRRAEEEKRAKYILRRANAVSAAYAAMEEGAQMKHCPSDLCNAEKLHSENSGAYRTLLAYGAELWMTGSYFRRLRENKAHPIVYELRVTAAEWTTWTGSWVTP